MSQRVTSGYGLGGPAPYGAMPSQESEASFLDQVRVYTTKIEDMLDNLSEPVKP